MVLLVSKVMTGEQAATLHNDAAKADDVLCGVITENPADYPGRFVARPMSARSGGFHLLHLEGDSLDSVRALLPQGLFRLPRAPADDPVIVETWI